MESTPRCNQPQESWQQCDDVEYSNRGCQHKAAEAHSLMGKAHKPASVKDLIAGPTFLQSLTPTERSDLLRPTGTGWFC